jgi:hypothetical protein
LSLQVEETKQTLFFINNLLKLSFWLIVFSVLWMNNWFNKYITILSIYCRTRISKKNACFPVYNLTYYAVRHKRKGLLQMKSS